MKHVKGLMMTAVVSAGLLIAVTGRAATPPLLLKGTQSQSVDHEQEHLDEQTQEQKTLEEKKVEEKKLEDTRQDRKLEDKRQEQKREDKRRNDRR